MKGARGWRPTPGGGLPIEIIRKQGPVPEPPPLLGDYAAARKSFAWDSAAASLGVPLEGPLNLGALAVRRGGAIVWHGARGEERRLSSDDLARGSARFAGALAARGVARGDRVLVVSRACPELVFAFLGALRFGAVPVVLGRLRGADALRHIAGSTRPALMVMEPAFKPAIDPLRKSLPALKLVVFAGKEGPRPRPGPGEMLWEDFVGPAAETFEDARLPAGQPAWLHYTELGMTGSVTPHGAAFALASSAAHALDLRPGAGGITMAVPGDPYFVPYAIAAPLLAGATSFVFEDPARFAGFGVFKDPVHTWYSPVRAMDVVLRNDPGLSDLLARCRHVVVTHPYDPSFIVMTQSSYGSPLHPAWWPRDLGVIQTAEFRSGDIRVGSIGRPLPGVEMVVDRGTGCLALRVGPGSPFGGYWNDPEQTARRVRNGWYMTDQRGRIDPDGYAWIVA